jgi:hypothetical protein
MNHCVNQRKSSFRAVLTPAGWVATSLQPDSLGGLSRPYCFAFEAGAKRRSVTFSRPCRQQSHKVLGTRNQHGVGQLAGLSDQRPAFAGVTHNGIVTTGRALAEIAPKPGRKVVRVH